VDQPGLHERFTALVRQHQAMVYSIARHVLTDPEDAAEVAQDVFCKLYQHLDHLESEAHILFWLRQVASRHAVDRFRRRKLRPRFGLEEVPEPATHWKPADAWQSDRLRRALSRLSESHRIVVVLRYQEDLDPREIAEILGESVNTVKSRLHRALRALQASPAWAAPAGEATS